MAFKLYDCGAFHFFESFVLPIKENKRVKSVNFGVRQS